TENALNHSFGKVLSSVTGLSAKQEKTMRYLHTMVRVRDIDESLVFYVNKFGLEEIRRTDNEKGRFTLNLLAASAEKDKAQEARAPELEVTYSCDPETYSGGRNFGHLAYAVDDIYEACQKLKDAGVTINRPPRDGHMAFIKSPDGISIELIQKGERLAPQEPWASAENIGTW